MLLEHVVKKKYPSLVCFKADLGFVCIKLVVSYLETHQVILKLTKVTGTVLDKKLEKESCLGTCSGGTISEKCGQGYRRSQGSSSRSSFGNVDNFKVRVHMFYFPPRSFTLLLLQVSLQPYQEIKRGFQPGTLYASDFH